MSYSRFAIYDVPPKGALAGAGAAWLGWDVAAATDIADPIGGAGKEAAGQRALCS